MKKTKILGLALAAAMVLGSTSAAMAAEPDSQGYSFNKVYQLTGGMTETAKSPAETFSFVSTDSTPVDGEANLYAVADTSYNDHSDPEKPKNLEDLKETQNQIPDGVKHVNIGTVSYAFGEAKNEGNFKSVAITVPDASEYKSVGFYYYKFTEKQGDTAGVTYNSDTNIVRVAVTNEGTTNNLKIGGVELLNADLKSKKENVVNYYASGRLKLIKAVTGNMGDKNREFNVKVTFNADGKKIKAPININTNQTELNNQTEVTPVEGGSSSMSVELKVKNGTVIEFSNIPAGVTYQVIETHADGYETPKYRVNNQENSTENGVEGNVTGGAETSITITNQKEEKIDTGVFTSNLPYIIILAGAAAGLALFFAGKKRRVEE